MAPMFAPLAAHLIRRTGIALTDLADRIDGHRTGVLVNVGHVAPAPTDPHWYDTVGYDPTHTADLITPLTPTDDN